MSYEKEKDKLLSCVTLDTVKGGKIYVSKYQYGDSIPKIQITRSYIDKDDNDKYTKLGRMTINEAGNVSIAIQEILKEKS